MSEIAPQHDTVHHTCHSGDRGPLVPFYDERPPVTKEYRVDHVRCAACGKDFIVTDLHELAQIWWSQGAYDGVENAERARRARMVASEL